MSGWAVKSLWALNSVDSRLECRDADFGMQIQTYVPIREGGGQAGRPVGRQVHTLVGEVTLNISLNTLAFPSHLAHLCSTTSNSWMRTAFFCVQCGVSAFLLYRLARRRKKKRETIEKKGTSPMVRGDSIESIPSRLFFVSLFRSAFSYMAKS